MNFDQKVSKTEEIGSAAVAVEDDLEYDIDSLVEYLDEDFWNVFENWILIKLDTVNNRKAIQFSVVPITQFCVIGVGYVQSCPKESSYVLLKAYMAKENFE